MMTFEIQFLLNKCDIEGLFKHSEGTIFTRSIGDFYQIFVQQLSKIIIMMMASTYKLQLISFWTFELLCK